MSELPRTAQPAFRLGAVLVIILLVAGGLTYRLVNVQLLNADDFVEIGRRQRFRTVTLSGGRGDILDRGGNPLAVSLPATSFFADPQFVEDPILAAQRLAPVLGQSAEDLLPKLGGEGRFAWLARQVSDAKAAEILALDIPGVFTTEEPSRFHPAGDALARSVIGAVDIDNLGSSGVEVIYNDLLEGKAGELQIEIGVNGSTIPGAPERVDPAAPGADILLTIDRPMQFEVERILRQQIVDMGAQGGVVIVSRPASGEVLAMASMAHNDDGELVSPSINMASAWTFEPGSVMKAMTFASVLDAGIADTRSVISVPDTYELYEEVFTDSTPHAPAQWTIPEIVTVSSNVGTIRWAEHLGGDLLDQYMRRFGFGASPRLGFPGESEGLMLEDDWGGVGTATLALGQGMSVTPVQMLNAYNAIANDGVYTPMQIVREVVHADGTRDVPERATPRRIISSPVSREVRLMLENAVAVGTGVNAQVDGYRVAGKTGTARKARDQATGYQDEAGNYRYVTSFVGFLPADQPELSILVTIDRPTASIYAGHVAAPAFADIARYAVRHLRIAPPTGIATPNEVAVPAPIRLDDRVSSEAATVPEDGSQGDPSVETFTDLDAASGEAQPSSAEPAIETPAPAPAEPAAPPESTQPVAGAGAQGGIEAPATGGDFVELSASDSSGSAG